METAELPLVATAADREVLFRELYKSAFPAVAAFVRKMNGSQDDAHDIFQDALVIFYEKQAGGDFSPHTTRGAYILGIARHLWMRKFRSDRKNVSLHASEGAIEVAEYADPPVNDHRLLHLLETTGQKCLNLLQAFYYERLPLAGIARTFGFGSERSATVQKYKCLEKLRDHVKAKTILYEDFFE